MSGFVLNPHFPQHKASLVLVKQEACCCFKSLGIRVLSPAPNQRLSAEINEHPDILCHHLGDRKILVEPSQVQLTEKLMGEGFEVLISSPVEGAYPNDIKLDCARLGGIAYGLYRYTEPKLLAYFSENGITYHRVKQGYAKCLSCFVTERAVITEDEGIYRALTSLGADALLIEKGDVALSDTHYGFLGGASGKIDKNTLAFYGDLHYHRNKDIILSFLEAHGVKPLYLRNAPLKDIGGILCLKTKDERICTRASK